MVDYCKRLFQLSPSHPGTQTLVSPPVPVASLELTRDVDLGLDDLDAELDDLFADLEAL